MRYEIEGDVLTGIADAIREKTGKSALITPNDMADEIGDISGAVLQEKTITENGVVLPDVGYDGMSSVTVNVSGGELTLPNDYQEVEYLDFDGASWFHVNFSFLELDIVETDVMWTDSDTSEQVYVGTDTSNDTRKEFVYIMQNTIRAYAPNSSSRLLAFFDNTYAGMASDSHVRKNINQNEKHRSRTIIIDTALNQNGFYVGRYITGLYFRSRGYKIDIRRGYDANGTKPYQLAVSLVPCYRKADGVVGMYDVVNAVFYVNEGTGTFTKGPDVT